MNGPPLLLLSMMCRCRRVHASVVVAGERCRASPILLLLCSGVDDLALGIRVVVAVRC